MEKCRLDILLLERGLASTRTKAQELILQGHVSISGKRVEKPGEKVAKDAEIHLSREEHPYVSRGGVKLSAALAHFSISPADKIILDLGISTGGFTDCVLRAGAKKVFGVDVGTNQLSKSLRQEPRLVFFESTHIKDLRFEQIGIAADMLVADLSFISLKKVIPYFASFLHQNSDLLLLVKPQFELDKKSLNAKGLVKSESDRQLAIDGVRQCMEENGYQVNGVMPSPISGGDGNLESFLHAVLRSRAP
jgi:23S rRNA (cytidine1920-2'-O)/16S rRNA (cytidine1409-2'-O)-methyltransferase